MCRAGSRELHVQVRHDAQFLDQVELDDGAVGVLIREGQQKGAFLTLVEEHAGVHHRKPGALARFGVCWKPSLQLPF